MVKTTIVLAMGVVLAMAGAASAVTQTEALYRCGEDDAGAADGGAAGATLKATVGTDATLYYTTGSGAFSSDTHDAACSSLSLGLTPQYSYTGEEYLNGRATDWGMEAWLLIPQDTSGQQRAFSNGYYGSGIGIRNGAWTNDATADVPVDAALLGTWANVAFVYDGGVETWYVNQSPIASATRNATWSTAIQGDLHIGTMNSHSGTWNSGIDEVRIFTFEAGAFDPATDLGACDGDPEYHPGDANGDGTVDLQDFGSLKSNFGATTGAVWADGDFNADGTVDLQDFGILKENFGHTAGDPLAAVPEPTTLALLAIGGLAAIRRRRTR